MPHAHWTPDAETDLGEIAYSIAVADQRPITADRIIDEIRVKVDLYATQPSAGTLRRELGQDVRTFSHKHYISAYHPIDNGIEVLRVFDGERDYPRLFS